MTAPRARILVVDDEEIMRLLLQKTLTGMKFEVTTACDGPEALEGFEPRRFDLVLTDLKMPHMDGVALTRKIRALDAEVPILLMSAHGTIEDAVAAIKEGADDFIPKPLSMEALNVKIRKILQTRLVVRERTELRHVVEGLGELVGGSAPMRKIYALIERSAPTDVTVLIQGETGTGKELVSRAIHVNSPRKSEPFIAINCAALTESLLESELFGHERGAFTGAHERKMGVIERARGGTLFLDEISSSSLGCQARLLRAIQEHEIIRVGSSKPIIVDFRLVAATNADLKEAVKTGQFREDLYYRITPLVIDLPPLRERMDDLPGLVDHLVLRLSKRLNRPALPVTEGALRKLGAYSWPGNVRELENALERALVIDTDGTLEEGDFALGEGIALRPKGIDRQRESLANLLTETGGNVSEAARKAGIRRNRFYEKLKKFGLDPASFRPRSQ